MNPIQDYYNFLNDFKKSNKTTNFKKSSVKCPYCTSRLKGNSLKYHMTKTHMNIENKYKRLGKYSEISIRNNYNGMYLCDMSKNNTISNNIPKYMININDNNIIINNKKINDSTKKKKNINLKNSSEHSIDSLEKKFNFSESSEISNLSKSCVFNKDNKDKELNNIKEYNDFGISDFKEKNIENEEKNNLFGFNLGIYTFKHELPTNAGKITEEFIIKGSKIISNLNKEETLKRIYGELCKICNYFLDYNKYDFTQKEILRNSDKIIDNKAIISKKRKTVEKYENLEEVKISLQNLKDKGYFNYN